MRDTEADNVLEPLPPAFFDRPADIVARELIGARLVRHLPGRTVVTALTETEAYLGPHDLACHAARGRTKRTDALYGPPGTLYVYLCYGIHWMLNIVTREEGHPAAVLVRGATIASGPGRLGAALAIGPSLNAKPMGRACGLWLLPPPPDARPPRILATPRIGIDYAGPIWAKRKLRYVLGEMPAPGRSARRNR